MNRNFFYNTRDMPWSSKQYVCLDGWQNENRMKGSSPGTGQIGPVSLPLHVVEHTAVIEYQCKVYMGRICMEENAAQLVRYLTVCIIDRSLFGLGAQTQTISGQMSNVNVLMAFCIYTYTPHNPPVLHMVEQMLFGKEEHREHILCTRIKHSRWDFIIMCHILTISIYGLI